MVIAHLTTSTHTTHWPTETLYIGQAACVPSTAALQAERYQSTALTCTAVSAGLNKALCLLCHPYQLYTRPGV